MDKLPWEPPVYQHYWVTLELGCRECAGIFEYVVVIPVPDHLNIRDSDIEKECRGQLEEIKRMLREGPSEWTKREIGWLPCPRCENQSTFSIIGEKAHIHPSNQYSHEKCDLKVRVL